MNKPRICVVITDSDISEVKSIDRYADFFEVRIDLIGAGWTNIPGQLNKPWVATNRKPCDGGKWKGGEAERLHELLKAAEMGANIIDIELETPNVHQFIEKISLYSEPLISYHNLKSTPALSELTRIIELELKAGARICKVVTTADTIYDNLTLLELIKQFSKENIISFGMGAMGILSRVMAPLAGSYFTYGSLKEGKESALGQLTADELVKIYNLIQ